MAASTANGAVCRHLVLQESEMELGWAPGPLDLPGAPSSERAQLLFYRLSVLNSSFPSPLLRVRARMGRAGCPGSILPSPAFGPWCLQVRSIAPGL